MRDSIREKLEHLADRHGEVMALLADSGSQSNPTEFRELSKEYARLDPVVSIFQRYTRTENELTAARAMLDDPDLAELAADEIRQAGQLLETLEPELELALIPPDPNDNRNVFLEIRAGTGGAEAALFAGDLLRMYLRYAEQQGWSAEAVNESLGEHGGYKEVVYRISGQNVYSVLKFEPGAHRVQRVPQTEAQGRIHTSACTVAVLPEPEEIDNIAIDPSMLRVDTYRASGAGGQHINKTESAIRITHLPSGIVVECQDERSQHKNRARAMSLLQAKLLSQAQNQLISEQSESRKLQVGSGDRSERIRTYNFPQNRLTDHRINLTLYKLDEIMAGQLGEVISPLIKEYQAEQLASLSQR